MCYAPYVVIKGKFKGGLKKYIGAAASPAATEAGLRNQLASGEAALVPCGRCLQCRIQYAERWAVRMELELKGWNNAHFITLTYEDDKLPIANQITGEHYKGIKYPLDYYSGKTYERPTLEKDDIQRFFKRLRKQAKHRGLEEKSERGLKLFYCGEYGEKNGRPHYHIILYGLIIPDLQVKQMKAGYTHFGSEWIKDVWGNGVIDIGSVTPQSCRYVARYAIKKAELKSKQIDDELKKHGITPEFISMSKNPGIGMNYYTEHRKELYPDNGQEAKIYLANGKIARTPNAFDRREDAARLTAEQPELEPEEDGEAWRIEKPHSDYMQRLKEQRRETASRALLAQLANTTATMLEQMDIRRESIRANGAKAMHRTGDGQ